MLDPDEDESSITYNLGMIEILRRAHHELNPAGESVYFENGTALDRVVEIVPVDLADHPDEDEDDCDDDLRIRYCEECGVVISHADRCSAC